MRLIAYRPEADDYRGGTVQLIVVHRDAAV